MGTLQQVPQILLLPLPLRVPGRLLRKRSNGARQALKNRLAQQTSIPVRPRARKLRVISGRRDQRRGPDRYGLQLVVRVLDEGVEHRGRGGG